MDVPGLDIEAASYTAMLIHVAASGSAPTGGQDLDVGNDGLDALPTGWTILDDVSVLDGGNSDRAYGQIVFSSDGSGNLEPGATLIDAGTSFANDTIHHVMRVGDSSGATAGDWVAFRHEESPTPTPPDFFILASTNPAYAAETLITGHGGALQPDRYAESIDGGNRGHKHQRSGGRGSDDRDDHTQFQHCQCVDG